MNSKQIGFELCKQVRNSNVTRISGSVYDLRSNKHGTFDIVYCFGLLYHLRHPLLALDKIYAVTKEMTFVNNQIFSGYSTEPNTILFFNETWRGSYTNWFVPTPKAFIEMVSNIGYKKIEVVDVGSTSVSLICYK